MELSNNKNNEYIKRLLLARLRLLNNYSFYGLLLMNTNFGIDKKANTAYTDGKGIYFGPKFLDELNDNELEFILMHEILHMVLKHCYRGLDYNNNLFNIACDIVVNSNILKSKNMDLNSITLSKYGVSMHLAPNGEEGFNYTAEEVYQMLTNKMKKEGYTFNSFDNHNHWEDDIDLKKLMDERLSGAISTLKASGKGDIPLGAKRIYEKITESQIDWKEILNNFISKELSDYSFNPPDKRYNDDFFLPDFNVYDESIYSNLLFVVDTSGSISNKDLGYALAEIKGAIDLSNNIKGYIYCLDAKLYDPIPINEFDIDNFKCVGGGGTSFISFFKKLGTIRNKMEAIDLIIFITDGHDTFPKESDSLNIPVLWIINNKKVTPPWGMVARINVNNN